MSTTTPVPITEAPAKHPYEMSDGEVRAEALRWVNDLRSEYECPPLDALPPGTPGHAGACVLVMATAGITDGTPVPPAPRYQPDAPGLVFGHGGKIRRRPIPAVVEEFAARFDIGHYPDLIG